VHNGRNNRYISVKCQTRRSDRCQTPCSETQDGSHKIYRGIALSLKIRKICVFFRFLISGYTVLYSRNFHLYLRKTTLITLWSVWWKKRKRCRLSECSKHRSTDDDCPRSRRLSILPMKITSTCFITLSPNLINRSAAVPQRIKAILFSLSPEWVKSHDRHHPIIG